MPESEKLEPVRVLAGRLRREVDDCMIADRRALLRRIRRLKGRQDEAVARRGLERVEARIAESRAKAAARLARIPTPSVSVELPIDQLREQVIDAIRSTQCLIVCGETGSGKTTQLPQLCLEAGRGVFGTIGHTQPRRVAARAVAKRIAFELSNPPGDVVGHHVRFDRVGSSNTLVSVMTDGILLAELAGDPKLERYDTIIIDEAHERSVNIDFLLGCLHRLLPKRPELRVIITSATIDSARFAEHFVGAKVITIPGRTFPVDIVHAESPIELEDMDSLTLGVVESVRRADRMTSGEGDILVFLPGEREIRGCVRRLEGAFSNRLVLPLYARLSLAAQERVLKAGVKRRIICTTNVAETSLTVPSVRAVVDSGLARVSRWSARRHVQRLPIEPVAKASCIQRAGRAGRVAAGVCVRMYTEADFDERPDSLEPEIRRTDLAGVLLRMAALHLGKVSSFPFLDAPRRTSVHEAERLLTDLGAMQAGRLTAIGRAMSQLPVEPRVARMLLAAKEGRCLDTVLVIAAGLAIPDPRLRPPGEEAAADAAHLLLGQTGTSDFLAIHTLWRHFIEHLHDAGSSKTRRWCHANHLSWVRMLEWREIHGQLRRAMRAPGLLAHADPPVRSGPVHRALLAGLIAQIGRRTEEGEYEGPGGQRFSIHPSSVLARSTPTWAMAGELVETSKLWGRYCATIHPSWIARVAPHLVLREHLKPHWDGRRGYAVANEQITLRGLMISKGRRVNLESIDPSLARSIFIEHVFVGSGDDFGIDSLADSRMARNWIQAAEDRLRTRTLLLPPHRRAKLWDARLPDSVIGMKSLQVWLKHADTEQLASLRIRSEELLRDPDNTLYEADAFPDTLDIGCGQLRVVYRFADGEADDGLTIRLPLPHLLGVDGGRAEWLVPGMLAWKIEALLRGLPKDRRRALQPLPKSAAACVDRLAGNEGDFKRSLARVLGDHARVSVSIDELARVDLPAALVPRWEVLDNDRVIASGRDLESIRMKLGDLFQKRMSAAVQGHPESSAGHVVWDMGELSSKASLSVAGETVTADVVLIDRGHCVDVQVRPRRASSEASHFRGVRRLAILAMRGEIDAAFGSHANCASLGLAAAMYGGEERIRNDARVLTLALARFNGGEVRSKEAFDEACNQVWGSIDRAASECAELLEDVWTAAVQTLVRIDRRAAEDLLREEAISATGRMLGEAFPQYMAPSWASRVPRWLRALQRRLAAPASVADLELRPWDQLLDRTIAKISMTTSLAQMVCLLEEYRAARHGEPPRVKVTPGVLAEQWKAVLRDGGS
jgi:ATP-dependent helicase HrpA